MFKQIYFWMYYYQQRIKTDKSPAISAFMIISLLQIMNILSIYGMVNYFLHFDIIEKYGSTNLGLISSIVVALWNYFNLYTHRDEICSEYESLSSERKEDGKILFWFYVIMSPVIVLLVGSYFVTPKY